MRTKTNASDRRWDTDTVVSADKPAHLMCGCNSDWQTTYQLLDQILIEFLGYRCKVCGLNYWSVVETNNLFDNFYVSCRVGR